MCCARETADVVPCTNGHVFCHECVERTANMLLTRMEPPPLECLCFATTSDQCTGIIAASHLAKTKSGMQLLFEMRHIGVMKRTLGLIHRFSSHDDMANAITLRLQRVRSDGTYRAYACARCGYGPLDHANCENLVEHHKRGGIDNSCPRCGSFAADVHELATWRDDGPD